MASEFSFNLKKARIYQAVKWNKFISFRFLNVLRKLSLTAFVVLLPVFLYGFLTDAISLATLSSILGLAVLSLAFFLIFWIKGLFIRSKLQQPKLKFSVEEAASNPEDYNLAELLSFRAAKAADKCFTSTHLLYSLLSDDSDFQFVFSRALLDFKWIKKLLKDYINKFQASVKKEAEETFSEDFQQTIYEALKVAQRKGHQRIQAGDVLAGLAKHDPIFKKILIDSYLKAQDIENLTLWMESLKERIAERKRFWEWKNLVKKGSFAKAWAAGYTITLDQYSLDLSEVIKKQGFPETIGHKEAIKSMERILSRREINNVLIVGEPGSGRKSMIQALAKKSVLGESLPAVNYKRVVQLDLPSLLAQTETHEQVESILDEIFREVASAGNIILVIDELQNFVGGAARPGMIDISGVISSYLALPQFQIAAICTFEGLHKNIEQNSSILSLFEKVEVSGISEEETLILLESLALNLEYRYKKFISYPALRDIIQNSAKYLPSTPFPEKAMSLMDEVMVHLSQTKDKVLLPKHVAVIISEKTQVPVGEMEEKEKETLLNLETLIHERIINQEEAVDEVSTALRRARAEVTVRKGPIGTFLFLGPTGVGKTETSKALAQVYFGAEERMIRLDMSEFQSVEDIPRLIGSPGEEGLLTTKVRQKPFSLILLDEIEKAHPNVLNLFLQVLDEGNLTDGMGRKVDFTHSIIIATSNAGYQIILKAIKERLDWGGVKQMILDYLFQEGLFRPEFINRFDAMVIFKPLSKENLLDIAGLLLLKLKKNLKEKEIDFVITDALKEKVAELGYDPTFGARQMRRVIQDKVENLLASAILSGELKRGQRAEIDPEGFELIIT